MPTLAIACEADGVLGVVAPLALAAAADTALVVDLDEAGPAYPGGGSLADLVDQGPRLEDLRPSRSGVAVLRNGGVSSDEAAEVVGALTRGWPTVVLRVPAIVWPGPVVPVVPLLPAGMTTALDRPAVYQQVGWPEKAPGPGLTIATPPRRTVAALLCGVLPTRSRWISAWREVWSVPWV